jgi:hypothetical protein
MGAKRSGYITDGSTLQHFANYMEIHNLQASWNHSGSYQAYGARPGSQPFPNVPTGWRFKVDNKPLGLRIYEIQENVHFKGPHGGRCREGCLLCDWMAFQYCMGTPWGCYDAWVYSPEGRPYLYHE